MSESSTPTKTLRVAVIGAGAAGLCAARHLASRPHLFEPHVFEKTGQVGGTWVYTDKTGKDEYGQAIHSSMYWNLRTNLPKEVMAFPDFPFNKSLPSFITHQDVLQYLQNYCQHFDLNKYIKFNTSIESVSPVHQTGKKEVSWDISYKDVTQSQGNLKTQQYDAVLVCNGHFSVPKSPHLPGIDEFQGEVTHSHDYRYPQQYQDKVIVMLGAGASGQDIAIDVAKEAKQVILSSRKEPLQSPLPDNVTQMCNIDRLTSNEVIFVNGDRVQTDVLMFCTGYYYTFPFLTPECNVKVNDGRVTPLYKHVIHTEYPNLAFIGICHIICPFPQFNSQVKFSIAAIDGSMELPNQEDMEKDIANDYEKRLAMGFPHRYAHRMGNLQWAYDADISSIGKYNAIPNHVSKLYDYFYAKRATNLMLYKRNNYVFNSETGTWKEIKNQ
ncbi:uncharacterized protein LOC144437333 [Glandiceps talaboti]